MKYLDTITDKTIFTNPEFDDREEYVNRTTVKAIAINKEGKIALITNDVHNLYTLPGGGADSDNLVEEVSRECIEEINYDLVNIKELARVKEIRNREAKKYETICFVGEINNKFEEDTRTEDEKNNNLRVEWLSNEEISEVLNKQLEMLKRGEISFYNTAFNVYRDCAFWNEYLNK